MANTNSLFRKSLTDKLAELMLAGAFPKVNYKKEGGFTSYSLFDYIELWGRASLVVHKQLQARGFERGIFATRLRSKAYADTVNQIVSTLTEESINAEPNRLKNPMYD